MIPSRNYQLLMEQPGFVVDAAQQNLVALLDDLFERVVDARPERWWQGLFSQRSKWPAVNGLYFWGGVGRGKTMLMDLFYQSLPAHIERERTHFHSFMNGVHLSLQRQGNIENPLQQVARDIASRVQVLCLDEFVIVDIGDAMIIAGLLEALFAEGVVLVTTSNVAGSSTSMGSWIIACASCSRPTFTRFRTIVKPKPRSVITCRSTLHRCRPSRRN
jgi:cell division protein ZapE